MGSDEEVALAAVIIATFIENHKCKKRRKRKEWVKPWLQRRNSHGFYSQLLCELRLEEKEISGNYLCMAPENFEKLLGYIKEDIWKEDTHLRESIPPETKLALTIRFPATGNSYQDLSMYFCIHKLTIAQFIPEVCQSIYTRLKDTYLKLCNFYY